MKKAIFIIPYYGKLPCFFQAWLISAKAQKNIDFLLISDLIGEEVLYDSDNIKVLNWTYQEAIDYIQSKFDFKINIEKPYKFCDFKPAYGYIFSEYIKDYDFWGHCDIDTVLGDLYQYLEKPMEEYDVIGRWGHLSLYKNTEKINRLFMSDKGFYDYKTVFSSKYSYCFDETPGMKMIVSKTDGLKVQWKLDRMVDAKSYRDFVGSHGFKNYPKQIFLFYNGKLYQCYQDGKEVRYYEILYLHFQKKAPEISGDIGNSFYIFYDKFIPRTGQEQDIIMLDRMKRYQSPIYRAGEKFVNYYFKRSVALLKMDKEQRKINNEKRKLKIEG